jgi:hypothetical protein
LVKPNAIRVRTQKRIVRHRKTIDVTLDHGLSNRVRAPGATTSAIQSAASAETCVMAVHRCGPSSSKNMFRVALARSIPAVWVGQYEMIVIEEGEISAHEKGTSPASEQT